MKITRWKLLKDLPDYPAGTMFARDGVKWYVYTLYLGRSYTLELTPDCASILNGLAVSPKGWIERLDEK